MCAGNTPGRLRDCKGPMSKDTVCLDLIALLCIDCDACDSQTNNVGSLCRLTLGR